MLTYRKAMNILVRGGERDERADARYAVEREVCALCETDTDGLSEWIAGGSYPFYVSARALAKEWDMLSAD